MLEVFHASILLACALALSRGGLEAHKFGTFQRKLSGKMQSTTCHAPQLVMDI